MTKTMTAQRFLPLLSLSLCLGLGLSSCRKDEPTPKEETHTTTPSTKPQGTQEATIAISLSGRTTSYFSFLKHQTLKLSAEEAKASKDWDIAFRGLNGLTNSGDNGSGNVAVLRTETTDFDGLVNVTPFLDKAYTWTSDATISVTVLDRMPPREEPGTYNKLLVEAYSFDNEVHPPRVLVSSNVYIVRTAAGDYVKLQLLEVSSAYDSYKVRYAYLGTTGQNKLSPTTPSTPVAPVAPKVAGEAHVAVASPGGLEAALQGEDLAQLSKLIVSSGTLNQKDLDFVTKSLKVTEIDLSEATLSLGAEDAGFYNNSSLKTIIAPKNIERTESKWFSNTLATSIVFPGTQLKYFGGAVYNEKLKSIVLPSSVVELGEGAFANSNYEQITLSTSLKLIPANAFKSCRRLTQLTIPAGVKEIKPYAFANCPKLAKITFLCPAPTFSRNEEDEHAFEGYAYNEADPTFIVPKGTKAAYLKALEISERSLLGQRFEEAE